MELVIKIVGVLLLIGLVIWAIAFILRYLTLPIAGIMFILAIIEFLKGKERRDKHRIITYAVLIPVLCLGFLVGGKFLGWLKSSDVQETNNTTTIKTQTISNSEKREDKEVISKEVKEADTKDNKETEEKNNSEVYNAIPGLDAGSIKINLKNDYNLKFSGPGSLPNSKELLDTGEYFDSSVGTLICEIYEQNPMEISYVSFTVSKANVDIAFAKKFLGYCATIQFDNSEPEKAQQWVKNNLNSNFKKGGVTKTTINGVNFRLSGGDGGYSLQIYANGVDID